MAGQRDRFPPVSDIELKLTFFCKSLFKLKLFSISDIRLKSSMVDIKCYILKDGHIHKLHGRHKVLYTL